MAARALPVTTKLSQLGCGVAVRAVMISTVWPVSSALLSGARRRSTRTATQWLPMSECTA